MKTIVAPITPLITSSVIVLRISGNETLSVLQFLKNFKGNPIRNIQKNKVYAGQFVIDNKLLDNVVFYFFKSPNSYTGEDVMEISFHGNPLIVRKALSAIYSLGIVPAEPGEFTKRAFINGKLDLTQAESVLNLIHAKSESDLFFSFNSLNGGIKDIVLQLKDQLVKVSSIFEAFIDFPDDNLPEEELYNVTGILDDVKETLKKLIKSYDVTEAVRKDYKIAIVGKPNVGKSSLLNYFLKKNRAIVSEIPGTTRDYIEEEIYLSGFPVKIIDTAGVRQTTDIIEKIGLGLTKDFIDSADLILILLDLSTALTDEDFLLLDITKGVERIIIGNKCDRKSNEFSFDCDLEVSVKYDINMKDFFKLLESKFELPDSDLFNFNIVISERHKALFSDCLNLVENILDNFKLMSLDMLSLDLNSVIRMLSEVTGETYTEEILDNIFNKFCIGK